MMQKKDINEMRLEDFLSLEYNRILYEDFNSGLRDYLNDSAISLFKFIYRDIVYFMNNYKNTPHEVNSLLSDKYNIECRTNKNLILICIIHDTLAELTSKTKYSSNEGRYIIDDIDDFFYIGLSCFNSFFDSGNNLGRFKDYDGIQHLMDVNAKYRDSSKFSMDYESIKTIKQFVNSIDINSNKKVEIPPHSRIFEISNVTPRVRNYYYNKLTRSGYHPFIEFSEHGFYCLEKQYEELDFNIINGRLYDVKFNKLTKDSIKPYLDEYGQGFYHGYINFEENLKNEISTIALNTESFIIDGIFDRTKLTTLDIKKFGGFYRSKTINNQEISVISKEEFYKRGINGGEYYKAWEIILKGSKLFESRFEDVKVKNNLNRNIRKRETFKSLMWLNKQDFTELNNIHVALKENGYIDCDLRTFKKLFENRTDFSPVEWNYTATSLIYFYGRLFELKKIKASAGKWKTLQSLFECNNLNNATQIYSSIKNGSKNLPEKSFLDSLIK